MSGASAPSSLGAVYQPFPHEVQAVIIRKQGDEFHICVREDMAINGESRYQYAIVAATKDYELAKSIRQLITTRA